MFGKFLVTIVLIAIVWFGFQYLQRVAVLKDRQRSAGRGRGTGRPGNRQNASPAVEDMVRCPECGTWQTSRDAKSCGRKGCPY